MKFREGEAGATALEYAVMAAAIALAVLAAILVIGLRTRGAA